MLFIYCFSLGLIARVYSAEEACIRCELVLDAYGNPGL